MRQHGQRIEQVMADHGKRIANRCQVVSAVPFHEQRHVIEQMSRRALWKVERQFSEPALERGLRCHALFLSSGRKPRFRCTSNSEIAAGVMPWMRAAWPSVSGR